MKVIGRDQVTMYNESHCLRQQPGSGRQWQDSTWLHWWDLENQVGGVHRIGHEYNFDDSGPKIALWSNLVTPKGIYKHVVYQPLRESDKLARGWGGGDETCRSVYENGLHSWYIDDRDAGVAATLHFKDFHPSFCGFPGAGRTAEDIAPHHIDVGGSLTGSITMQDSTFKANGMGVRDHGWGHRDIGTMLSHRYVAGTFGPDFTFCAFAIHNGVNDSIETFGWVVKNADTVVFAKDVDIVAYTEIDSASTRGGHITLALADGDTMDCELTAVVPGLVNHFHRFANNNTLCRARAQGRDGAGMFETSMNFFNGTRVPEKMQRALIVNGFYPGMEGRNAAAPDSSYLAKRTY
jgi:hypothetical protein